MRPDWRAHVMEMLRGAAALDGELFAGNGRLSGLEQLEIYRRQFQLRIPPALAEDAPGLMHLAGEAWDALAERYLADHPPRTWSLDHLGRDLEAWLVQEGAPQPWIEMARLDEAVQRSFVAADGRTPLPEELGGVPRLKLRPHVELLRLGWSVHHFRAQVLGGDAPDPLVEDDFHVVVHRVERKVRHLEVAPACWRILDQLQLGIDESIARSGAEDPAEVQAWFRLFVLRGLVELDA